MHFELLDYVVFVLFIAFVIGVSLFASRDSESSDENYFLAGRKLTWWLIGFSLIASNISTEHFVGMAGRGYDIGLAIASYEWMAAVTLVIVALFFLPKFLKSGIYTMPQFLEYRYNRNARTLMATLIMMAYIIVALATVLYSGALALEAIYGLNIIYGIWLIGILAGGYTVYGGLKAVVWSDLIQGAALLLGGALVMVLGFQAIGGPAEFFEIAGDKLHTVKPWNDPEMPWVAVFFGGLWIPNLFYWGLNQFITQRALGARSLAEGQKGIMFAAFLKLLIPFIIVFPGIMAYHLYADQIANPDQAFPILMSKILPAGLRGAMFAALFGAVMSSLDSMLNSASTIFTVDIYKEHINRKATPRQLVTIGRVTTALFVIIGCLWSPIISNFGSVFQYIQKIWGFISPGIVAAFVFGMFSKRTPPAGAIGSMLLGIPIYGALLFGLPKVAFLHHMLITFACLCVWNVAITMIAPLKQPVTMPEIPGYDHRPSRIAPVLGAIIVALTAVLYIIFW
jgi:SSS family solute:Na+ symporter